MISFLDSSPRARYPKKDNIRLRRVKERILYHAAKPYIIKPIGHSSIFSFISIACVSELDFSGRILRYDFVKILGNPTGFPAFLPRIAPNTFSDKILRP